MRSFRTKPNPRRATFLALTNEVERLLREAYARKFEEGVTQAGLAKKLGVNRSAIHRRLTGATNMTLETVADMVWALGQCIEVSIFDPSTIGRNHFIHELQSQKPQAVPVGPQTPVPSAPSDNTKLLEAVMEKALARSPVT